MNTSLGKAVNQERAAYSHRQVWFRGYGIRSHQLKRAMNLSGQREDDGGPRKLGRKFRFHDVRNGHRYFH